METTERTTERITEALSRPHAVDEAGGIIRGVKLIGTESKNGRTYPPRVLQGAVQHYEGAKVNVDHPPGTNPHQPRSVHDRIGCIRNARYQEGVGIVGDFHFNPKHKLAAQIVWDAQNNPTAVGFSHNATISAVAAGNGRRTVESIVAVKSVDLVADPATTGGIFEGVQSQAAAELIAALDDLPELGKDDHKPNMWFDAESLTAVVLKSMPDKLFAFVDRPGKSGRERLWPLHNVNAVKAAIVSIPKLKRLKPEQRDAAMQKAEEAGRAFLKWFGVEGTDGAAGAGTEGMEGELPPDWLRRVSGRSSPAGLKAREQAKQQRSQEALRKIGHLTGANLSKFLRGGQAHGGQAMEQAADGPNWIKRIRRLRVVG